VHPPFGRANADSHHIARARTAGTHPPSAATSLRGPSLRERQPDGTLAGSARALCKEVPVDIVLILAIAGVTVYLLVAMIQPEVF
jgi:hypothetical protein